MAHLRHLSLRTLSLLVGVLVAVLIPELALRSSMPQLVTNTPAADVLFLTPDRVMGWKHPNNFEFFWNGRNPYCIEFGVQVTLNDYGFRDRNWAIDAPEDTVRIAFIGDSLIEGLQVEEDETMARRLEARLAARFPGQRFETMNFGVSNYSVGQYLLQYDESVRRFRPDYVVLLAAYENFTRTTQRALSSRLQDFYTLHIRPSYELDAQGNLVHVPAADYDRYVASVSALLDRSYGEDRSRPIHRVRSPLYLTDWMLNRVSRALQRSEMPQPRRTTEFPDVELNYKILQTLHRRVASDSAKLVFADAFDYLERYALPGGSGALVDRNRTFIESLGAGYVDVSPALRRAPSNPQFECDMHFSRTGHHVIADALFDWFATELQ